MMNTNRTLKLTTLALCGVINILGGTIALLLRLPVLSGLHRNSSGSRSVRTCCRPRSGTDLPDSFPGMTSDVYAFYYIPGAACHRSRCPALYSADSARPIRQDPAARVFPSAPWAGSCFRQRL